MKTRQLGNSGIAVSEIGLGTMTYGRQNSPDQAYTHMTMATALGVNFIDTAELYPSPVSNDSGESESIVGQWLAAHGNRDKIILSTKIVGPLAYAAPRPKPGEPPPLHWIRGGETRFNKKHIAEAVDGSLRRLQTDYIDLFNLHWPDRSVLHHVSPYYRPREQDEIFTPIDETLRALQDVIAAGKVRAFGLANETPWGAGEFLRLADDAGLPRAAALQNPYNLLNRTFETGLAEFAARENCGLLAYSPLAFGVLSGKYLDGERPRGCRVSLFEMYRRYSDEKGDAAVADYIAVAREHGKSFAQMALAFILRQPFVTSAIIGVTTLDQLQENVAAVDFSADDELWAEVEALGEKHFNPCP